MNTKSIVQNQTLSEYGDQDDGGIEFPIAVSLFCKNWGNKEVAAIRAAVLAAHSPFLGRRMKVISEFCQKRVHRSAAQFVRCVIRAAVADRKVCIAYSKPYRTAWRTLRTPNFYKNYLVVPDKSLSDLIGGYLRKLLSVNYWLSGCLLSGEL